MLHHLHWKNESNLIHRSGELLYIRTLLQNSMTTLGDASTVGGANVAGSVWDTLGITEVGCCWSQSTQLESAIEMKHDKSSKLIR